MSDAVKIYSGYSTRKTLQSEPIPGEKMVANNAGGYAYETDKWQRLLRFLVIGSDSSTYYVKAKELTRDNAQVVEACLAEDGIRAVSEIVAVSANGRAPKNDPAIFALALAASVQNPDAQGKPSAHIRAFALAQLRVVCRIPTHLFHFLAYCKSLRRWSRMLRTAVGTWYASFTPEQLAYEIVKYQARDGWAHKDALRLSHVELSAATQATLRWAVGADLGPREVKRKNAAGRVDIYSAVGQLLPHVVGAFETAKTAQTGALISLIRSAGLTREMLPTAALNDPEIWAELLVKMPLTAMVRNLAKMTAVGLLTPLSEAVKTVTTRLANEAYIRKSRLHPMAILNALRVYQSGHGDKGSLTWEPVREVVDALDAAFYLAFGNVTPTNKPLMLALDVSGSMTSPIAGTGLSCREAAAAMALVTANVEPHYLIVGFAAGQSRSMSMYGGYGTAIGHGTAITELAISPRQRLDDVVRYLGSLPFGGTDCSLPMLYATEHKLDLDAFVVYTDSETWAGTIHPSQALREYRAKRNRPLAACAVVGMTATGFSIADPRDARMLDVVGFDLATPQAISEFVGMA